MTKSASTRTRTTPLHMDARTFREIGHQLVDQLAGLLEAVPEGPVTRDAAPSEVRRALGLTEGLPEQGTAPGPLIEETTRLLFHNSLFNGHPRFFGYITGSPHPIGMFGAFISAAANPNCGGWILSPAASEIEGQTVRWIAEFIGYPSDAGGLIVSGGNMANFVGLWAARTARAGWSIREQGLTGAPAAAPGGSTARMRVYGSAETHVWIQKAADLCGLGTDAVRWIPTDETLRMDVSALRRQVEADKAAGDIPFMVVGTGGSVGTGAVDPLPAIRDLCREHGLWFHVDAAYGGFGAAVSEAPDDLRALKDADSVAVDPHKWLYNPLEAGCALVRDPEKLRDAFSYHPPYYHFEERATNFVELGPQNSRGFKALKVWLGFRHAGASGYRTMISDNIRLSRRMAEAIKKDPELEWFTQSLSITTFRYVPADLRPRVGEVAVDAYLDDLNEQIIDRTQREGEIFVSNTVVRGRYVLRACIVNMNTGEADVDAVPGVIVKRGRVFDAEMRPKDL